METKMRLTGRILIAGAAIAIGGAGLALPAAAKKAAAEAAAPTNAATIMAYKRDPVPIYDNTGSKLRDVPQKDMPKARTAGARVIATKQGFVALMIDGKASWLRLTTVDYVGDLPAPACEKVPVQLALNEEENVARSLGLGCDTKVK